eukprot:1939-Heterococcus_DN1.PRE.3
MLHGQSICLNSRLTPSTTCMHAVQQVVKQTVMTSVYGVTYVGAKAQIYSQLEEKLSQVISTVAASSATDTDTANSKDDAAAAASAAAEAHEQAVHDCAAFLTGLTLEAIRGLFTEARGIMDWLATLAKLVARAGQPMAWVTPLGLPVVQPYRRSKDYTVETLLQTVSLVHNTEALPVESARQKSAFPPNFVHSLDSTHMLLTAEKMDALGLPFAAVHDSYWAHAGAVDDMNTALREAFVELYSQPVLEDLHRGLQLRFPQIEFPPVPDRGALDLQKVRESAYFFN